MGSSNRHKKQKQKDFAKRKLKVGKLAPRRANQTDASFKVRSISLNQRKTLSSNETDDEAFKKKLSILKKPTTNLNSRKAIMSEILHDISTQRDGLSGHMDEILKVSALLIIDRSRTMREMNLDLWSKLIELGGTDGFVLHLNTFLLFVNSAMTHLVPAIRKDSIKYLNCLLSDERISPFVVKSSWFKLLRNFMILMNWTSKADDSGKGKTIVVRESSSELMSKNLSKSRVEEITVLSRIIRLGCLNPVGKDGKPKEESSLQIHPFTSLYMIPEEPNPYSALKLFTEIHFSSNLSAFSGTSANKSGGIDYEELSTEDRENRIKMLCEVFGDGLEEGLKELSKEDNRVLAGKSKALLGDYQSIKKEYLLAESD